MEHKGESSLKSGEVTMYNEGETYVKFTDGHQVSLSQPRYTAKKMKQVVVEGTIYLADAQNEKEVLIFLLQPSKLNPDSVENSGFFFEGLIFPTGVIKDVSKVKTVDDL